MRIVRLIIHSNDRPSRGTLTDRSIQTQEYLSPVHILAELEPRLKQNQNIIIVQLRAARWEQQTAIEEK